MVKRRSLKRPLGERRYKKLFIIATEGTRTEPQYLPIFNELNLDIRVICLKGKNHSSPLHVLKRLKAYIEDEPLHSLDEAWLVIDKDNWPEEHLDKLFEWIKKNTNYGLAISNPLFEYWLLLHFEDGYGVTTGKECISRLKKHLPDYDKSLDSKIFTKNMIAKAIERAKKNDTPPCAIWPLKTGSTVYRLIERIYKKYKIEWISHEVRDFLKAHGTTKVFFAKKIGVNPTHLSRWISGQTVPRIENILKIEEATKGEVTAKDWLS